MGWLIHYAWLTPLGLAVGAYGTLIGAGGGFVLVPILLLLFPQEKPEVITSISLAVVFFNAASGSWAYARMRRIDYRAAAVFALAAAPGAALGAISTGLVPRRLFDGLLGGLLLILAVYLAWRPRSSPRVTRSDGDPPGQPATSDIDCDQPSRKYQYSVGALISAGVGYVASLLGIGGGVLHVPALIRILKFPVHTATATSHMILAVMAFTATVVHISGGHFHHGIHRTIALSIGVVLGAQLGAALSARIRGSMILRGLAVGLLLLGVRLVILSVSH